MAVDCVMILFVDVVNFPGNIHSPEKHVSDTVTVVVFLWSCGFMVAGMDRVNKMVALISDQVR